jgi:UDP-glucose 4-epimerase
MLACSSSFFFFFFFFSNDSVRDYIHVCDLAEGHVAAIDACVFGADAAPGCHVFNLGSGTGTSVLQMIAAVSKASGVDIKYEIAGRRSGDVAAAYANPAKATKHL